MVPLETYPFKSASHLFGLSSKNKKHAMDLQNKQQTSVEGLRPWLPPYLPKLVHHTGMTYDKGLDLFLWSLFIKQEYTHLNIVSYIIWVIFLSIYYWKARSVVLVDKNEWFTLTSVIEFDILFLFTN